MGLTSAQRYNKRMNEIFEKAEILKKKEGLKEIEGTYMKKPTKKEREQAIKVYAEHYPSPVSDISGFNKVLKINTGLTTRRNTVAKLLRYI